MTMAVIRFDMRAPGRAPAEVHELYRTALDMARWADDAGLDMLVLSEHHGAEDGYLPSPLVMAGAVAGATRRIPINVSALLVPLYDPVRLAEDLAVVDQLSGGRVSIVAGLGYRPSEYQLLGKAWGRRGRLMDEALELAQRAWTGQPFEHHGELVQVLPRPFQEGGPMVLIGGSGPRAADRAARFGLGLFPPHGDRELVARYREACERLGREPGLVLMPEADQPGTVVVAEDPDRAWQEVGPYLLHDAMTYKGWQQPGQESLMVSSATTVDELRAEGVYVILTPDECVALAERLGSLGAIILHPLCGGTPPELAWPGLELFAERVLPKVRGGQA